MQGQIQEILPGLPIVSISRELDQRWSIHKTGTQVVPLHTAPQGQLNPPWRKLGVCSRSFVNTNHEYEYIYVRGWPKLLISQNYRKMMLHLNSFPEPSRGQHVPQGLVQLPALCSHLDLKCHRSRNHWAISFLSPHSLPQMQINLILSRDHF